MLTKVNENILFLKSSEKRDSIFIRTDSDQKILELTSTPENLQCFRESEQSNFIPAPLENVLAEIADVKVTCVNTYKMRLFDDSHAVEVKKDNFRLPNDKNVNPEKQMDLNILSKAAKTSVMAPLESYHHKPIISYVKIS